MIIILGYWGYRKISNQEKKREKQLKEHQLLLDNLKIGDKISYYGLMYAKIEKINNSGDLGLKPLHYIKRGEWIQPISKECEYHPDFEKITFKKL